MTPRHSDTQTQGGSEDPVEAERGKEDAALMGETGRGVPAPPQKYLSVRQAAFIGVGAMAVQELR